MARCAVARLGVVARADDRGIATQTREFAAELSADRVLVVREPGSEHRGFPFDADRFPGAPVVVYDPLNAAMPEAPVRDFLEGLDVVYLVETPYDYRFFAWAREAGCRTVLHANPEFWRWDDPSTPRPDAWWLPTSWRANVLPDECRVVQVPVPTAPHRDPPSTSVEFVHVAGHRAAADRNGTVSLMQALRLTHAPMRVRVTCQGDTLPRPSRLARDVDAEIVGANVVDRWSLYDGAAALVLPRRYGGLCLPALEAMALGMAVVMTDAPPQNETWPIVPVDVDKHRTLKVPAGRLTRYDARPAGLAHELDMLVVDERRMERAQLAARQFAADNSWLALRASMIDELDRVCA